MRTPFSQLPGRKNLGWSLISVHQQILLAIPSKYTSVKFSSVQSISYVWLFVTPWNTALQVSLSITNSWSSLKLTSIESVMPSSHLILCRPLLLLPPIPLSIRVFSNESTLHMRWPRYWSFSFSISTPKNTQDWSPLEWTGWICLQTNIDSILKSRDIALPTKVRLVKAMVFPVVMYGC